MNDLWIEQSLKFWRDPACSPYTKTSSSQAHEAAPRSKDALQDSMDKVDTMDAWLRAASAHQVADAKQAAAECIARACRIVA